jgi:Ca2+-binding EF-hand superfamily protein
LTISASDTVHQRIERTFDGLDSNHDGYVDWLDYQNLVDRYLSAYQLGTGDRRARALQSIHEMLWLELLRHAGAGEDRLLKNEFVAATRLATVDISRLNAVEGLGHAIFDVVDGNGDNEITKDEFARLLREVWKVTAPESGDAFSRVDTDDDGTISRQEFLRAAHKYFHSIDLNGAGGVLIGDT